MDARRVEPGSRKRPPTKAARLAAPSLPYNRRVEPGIEPLPSDAASGVDEDEVRRASKAILLGSALGVILAALARDATPSEG